MKKYLLAIDQGTTSTRAILYSKERKIFYKTQVEVKNFFPKEGYVEQDALDIYLSVLNVINDIITKTNISIDEIDSLGITNQRETTIVWDKKTGMPVYNAIVWQSRQSNSYCEKWEKYKDLIHKKTGLILNPYFSASKIRYILDHIKDGQARAEKGELLFGTVDSWLIYKLTKNHYTDITNASRTMLFNINSLDYDDELLKIFNIPRIMLPEVLSSNDYYGNANIFGSKIKINGVAGDQQSSLFGQACFDVGSSKSTYGTGCFMLLNIGETPVYSKNGLLTTIAWKINNKVTYALEGSVFMGGATIQWLRDQIGLIQQASESEKYAKKVNNELGVYIVPAFVGLGAPYWDNECKGAIFGLTRGTTKAHLIRATLNSIAFQVKDIINVMENEGDCKIQTLKVDGGATANNYLMQFQADILDKHIILPEFIEVTALGAIYLAGLGSGYFSSLDEIKNLNKVEKIFKPQMNKEEINKLDKNWKKAIEATRLFK